MSAPAAADAGAPGHTEAAAGNGDGTVEEVDKGARIRLGIPRPASAVAPLAWRPPDTYSQLSILIGIGGKAGRGIFMHFACSLCLSSRISCFSSTSHLHAPPRPARCTPPR
ncbi:unnamed protein product [Prorocentrum cordatum]|uniref:Uncharacterized protein n=1 Tax=Prorocentrum cordatum TaxID=2364126 RepID=A0ABN9UJU7_9DINO|nr:unnamed protein product [Polarella glacialis]